MAGTQEHTFDVVVVGGGAVGENAADRAARTGLSVAIVEGALVGGECSYWACMPSKVLLRAGAARDAARRTPGVADPGAPDVAAVLARRDEITHHWDDSGQEEWVRGAGIALVRGQARFLGPRELAVRSDAGTVLVHARHAVILATGSGATIPPVDGLRGAAPWTSRDATSATHVPGRLAILGGGVVGVEMACAYADLGAHVTLLVRGPRLLADAEPFAGEAVADALVARAVDVRFGTEAIAVTRDDDGVHLRVTQGPDVHADEVLVATGRHPRTTDLGLETIGLEPGRPVEVDDAMQVNGVAGGWLFAAGDVTGRTGTTHQGKYDARVVGDVVAARFGGDEAARTAEAAAGPWSRYRATADHAAVPQVVFTQPEVAWVGLTERAARDAGLDVRVVSYDLADLAGASVVSPEYAGRAALVLDAGRDDRVVGATFVGPDAAEMLHAATIAVVGEVPLSRLWHAVPSYPTVSEVWLRFGEAAGL
ncbi:dihydrolipoyl dehydrogenase family protein [Cellulomonas gilvus]|uniref:Pyridine nucleotide-disulfide oxidoreductase dimerization region n=1 Tax=Cellulomonas gilvus (strain ATCC 13127 / NRRL B-14078) TaxID=593907 RepID=F8A1I0_CELGA|nr:NAD(P)/FAD-dependent oxidoreductase [Cellulomonas gilvus]AEI12864.1 pyridine nucleotide-disulfide oxidoreductase dimerization region [Cellulomonas gilvus ATCC 13127]